MLRGPPGSTRTDTPFHDTTLFRSGDGGHAKLPAPRAGARLELKSRFDFNLAGTEALDVVPLGDSNHIELDSPWPHPSFVGTLSPGTLAVGDDGFSARWELPALAAHTQAQYLRGLLKAGKGGTMRHDVTPISLHQIGRASRKE